MQSKIQIQNAKPVKMVEGLTEVAIHAFPHHCRIEVFAEKENVNIKGLSFLSVGLNFIGLSTFSRKIQTCFPGFSTFGCVFSNWFSGFEISVSGFSTC